MVYKTYPLIGIHTGRKRQRRESPNTEIMQSKHKINQWRIHCMRSDVAFCVGTHEIVPLYICSFQFLVGIWCCAYGKEGSEDWCFFPFLQPELNCLTLMVKPLILNLFRFSYEISSSKEHRWYLMYKIVFIFAVHLSLSDFRTFLKPCI